MMPNFYDPQEDRDTPTREDQRKMEEEQRKWERQSNYKLCPQC